MVFSENSFIEWLNSQVNVKNLGDDMAFVRNDDFITGYSVDQVIEGVHFTHNEDPKLVGRKLLARNLSDVAAKGMTPTNALVSINLANKSEAWLKEFYLGLLTLAQRYGVYLIGGDTACYGDVFSASLTIMAQGDRYVPRQEAKVGDRIFVTGFLGNSFVTRHHLNFTPRIQEGQFLLDYANAMIDISDGLSQDLARLCQFSKVTGQLDLLKLPLRDGASVEGALNDGEDYELLFSLSPHKVEALKKNWSLDTNLVEIGQIIQASKNLIVDRQNRPIDINGYDHLRQ